LTSGGIKGGGVNFDAKVRRNSTDPEDLFLAHIGSMDAFARGMLIANDILEKSDYLERRKNRYSSFDSGSGKAFEEGKLTLEDLRKYAFEVGEPTQYSGKQEYFENLINRFI
jgi:xylose isomerase